VGVPDGLMRLDGLRGSEDARYTFSHSLLFFP